MGLVLVAMSIIEELFRNTHFELAVVVVVFVVVVLLSFMSEG